MRLLGLNAEELGVLMGSAVAPWKLGTWHYTKESTYCHTWWRCGAWQMEHEKVNFGMGLKLSFLSLNQFSPKLDSSGHALLVHWHLRHTFMKSGMSRQSCGWSARPHSGQHGFNMWETTPRAVRMSNRGRDVATRKYLSPSVGALSSWSQVLAFASGSGYISCFSIHWIKRELIILRGRACVYMRVKTWVLQQRKEE